MRRDGGRRKGRKEIPEDRSKEWREDDEIGKKIEGRGNMKM